MKRLHITAEGQTEELFVNRTLRQYLASFNVFADVRCVLTGRKGNRSFRGGMTNYSKAKNDIVRWLNEELGNTDVAFTTMFDYYALPADFPGYSDAERLADPYQKVAAIETRMFEDIADERFIPYIQLHEFESLLFVEPQKFEMEFFEHPEGLRLLASVAEEFGNPELIDQGPNTAPSKRIISAFPGYADNKPVIGSMIANEIGVDELRGACHHFNEWVAKLIRLG